MVLSTTLTMDKIATLTDIGIKGIKKNRALGSVFYQILND